MAINLITPSVTPTACLIGDSGSAPGVSDSSAQLTTVNNVPISAALEVQSTLGGFVPPRMTTAQINAIATPCVGMQVYDNTIGVSKTYKSYVGFPASSNFFAVTNSWITVSLTATQIYGMRTPFQLAPPPGVGFFYYVNSWAVLGIGGSVSFTGGGTLFLEYEAGVEAAASISGTTLTDPLNNTYFQAAGLAVGGGGVFISTDINNLPLLIANNGGAFANGNGSAIIYINYSILPVQ
jgi:hypothetical protein